ncbi:unnamed protein product [Ilex paraguariensis]|uniref:Uncharacterized protein n=1 Tax=Ilex paraguariensis TaxID=185542 RepID=A0ABC8U2B0_9AQUA
MEKDETGSSPENPGIGHHENNEMLFFCFAVSLIPSQTLEYCNNGHLVIRRLELNPDHPVPAAIIGHALNLFDIWTGRKAELLNYSLGHTHMVKDLTLDNYVAEKPEVADTELCLTHQC